MNRYYKNILKSSFLGQIYLAIKLNSFKRKWIKKNKHNQTVPMNLFSNEVSVGNHSYGELNVVSFADKSKLIIGNCVSIAENVHFLLDVEHHLDHLSTYPFKVKLLETEDAESFSKGNIIVEDDVWIGYGATILSGVRIGKGAVIAAGSLVTKNVEPYSIVGGIPAKLIKKRFNEEIIKKLLEIDFSVLEETFVEKNLDLFYEPVTESNIDLFLKFFLQR